MGLLGKQLRACGRGSNLEHVAWTAPHEHRLQQALWPSKALVNRHGCHSAVRGLTSETWADSSNWARLKHDAAQRHVRPVRRPSRLHAHIEAGAGASHKH